MNALKKLETSVSYKVTGDTTATNIFDVNNEIHAVITDDVICTFQPVGGMDNDEEELINSFLMHVCIQSDPDAPIKWQDALDGPEREWWIKSITAEFNSFINRSAWKFVSLEEVKENGKKMVPTKLVFKKKDKSDGSIRFKT